MRKWFPILLYVTVQFLFFCTSKAQTVSNVKVAISEKNIEIIYDLEGEGLYNVSLYYADSSGKKWFGPLKNVSGDVGPNQFKGEAKKIVWDAAKEVTYIEGFFQFKVIADEMPLPLAAKKQALAEELPAKKIITDLERRKLTLAMEKAKRSRTPWLVTFLLMGGAGGIGYYQTGVLYNKYKTATSDAVNIRQTITIMSYAAPAALGLAGISFIEFLVKSSKYSNAKKTLNGTTTFKVGPTGLGVAYRF